jgi:protein-S-isoprenylcysteine O-methyltransferase Ste14
METEKHDFIESPNRMPWPPIIYAVALVGGGFLGWLVPLPWMFGGAADVLFFAGFIIIGGAIALDIAAMRTLHRAHTTIMPNRKAEHLVTRGVFQLTRNPIYLGNTLLVIGAGLISGIAWYFPLAFIAAYATQRLAIEREERHLEARFGKLFRDYRKKVKRWV